MGLIDYRGVSLYSVMKVADMLQDTQSNALDTVRLVVATKSDTSRDFKFAKGETFRVKMEVNNALEVCRPYGYANDDNLEGKVFLHEVVEKPRREWTTEDVCEYVIKLLTRKERTSWISSKITFKGGKKYRGTFVSQARRSKYLDLVKCLIYHFEKQSIRVNTKKTFVWLDVFCINQHLANDKAASAALRKRTEAELTLGFHKAIAKFESVVLFLDSWHDPGALKRAWCLWEMYGVFKAKSKLAVALPVDRYIQVLDILSQGKDHFEKSMLRVDVSEAQCSNKDDRDMILGAIGRDEAAEYIQDTISRETAIWAAKTGSKMFSLLSKLDFSKLSSMAPKDQWEDTSLEYYGLKQTFFEFFARAKDNNYLGHVLDFGSAVQDVCTSKGLLEEADIISKRCHEMKQEYPAFI